MISLVNQITCDEKSSIPTNIKLKNFGLTENEFNYFVSISNTGDTTFLKIIFDKHFDVCSKYLVKYMKLNSEDAIDISMNAIITFWDKFKAGKIKYGNLSFLLTKMAFQLHLSNKVEQNKLDYRLIEILSKNKEDEYCYECAKTAISLLNEVEQEIIFAYYVDNISLRNNAKSNNLNETSIRKRKQRAVEKFKREFFKIYDP